LIRTFKQWQKADMLKVEDWQFSFGEETARKLAWRKGFAFSDLYASVENILLILMWSCERAWSKTPFEYALQLKLGEKVLGMSLFVEE